MGGGGWAAHVRAARDTARDAQRVGDAEHMVRLVARQQWQHVACESHARKLVAERTRADACAWWYPSAQDARVPSGQGRCGVMLTQELQHLLTVAPERAADRVTVEGQGREVARRGGAQGAVRAAVHDAICEARARHPRVIRRPARDTRRRCTACGAARGVHMAWSRRSRKCVCRERAIQRCERSTEAARRSGVT